MSYSVCPNCGQKALTVATRCPRCGLAFEEQFFGRTEIAPKPRRIPLTVLIIGAGLALLVGNELVLKLKAPVRQAQPGAPPAPVVIVMPPAPQADSTGARPSPDVSGAAGVAVDSAGPGPLPQPKTTSAAQPPAPEVVPEPVPNQAAAVAAELPGLRRYASTWINVRADRRNSAPVLRILRPGDAIQVDSLAHGWYRVLSPGEATGYVDRRLLDTVPGPTAP